MHTWLAIVGLLFINNIYGDAIPPLCEDQIVRKAFSQAQWPDVEHEPHPSQRFYHPIEEKCLTKVDEPCPEVDATCAPNSECRSINDHGYIWRRCYCGGNGSIANWDKTYCGASASYGEDCSETYPYVACDPKDKLSCKNDKCGCQNPEKMVYDDNRCRLVAGEECDKEKECVDNAKCDRPVWNETRKCMCPHGTSKEGLCYRGLLQECSADRPCNVPGSLKCTDGICRCKEPLHQIYEDDKCVLLVGQKCTGSEGECVQSAECVDGICRCSEGFSETSVRNCRESGKKHGDTCENEECDFNKGLACLDGSCQCVDPTLKFEDHTKGCVASLGSRCGIVDVVGKGDGKCEGIDDKKYKNEVDHEREKKHENKYGNSTCPHYYVSCEGGRPCMQSADGETYCINL